MKKHIIIVDDEIGALKLIGIMLERASLGFVQAKDVKSALAVLNLTPETLLLERVEREFQPVQFSVEYPESVSPGENYNFKITGGLQGAFRDIEITLKRFAANLKGENITIDALKQRPQIKPGTQVVATIECGDIYFETISGVWDGWKLVLEHPFTIPENIKQDTLSGRLAIHIEGIEVASHKFRLQVVHKVSQTQSNQQSNRVTLDWLREGLGLVKEIYSHTLNPNFANGTNFQQNPLLEASRIAGKLVKHVISLYRVIFYSYAREDRNIVERCRRFAEAIGDVVLMDTHSILSGQDWRATIAELIDKADIFQLFWSTHAAKSEYVRYEWQYALYHKAPKTRGVGFIRPVRWEEDAPDLPSELQHIQCHYEPVLAV